jgi:4-amino-4-deoxy-L-arabinose transferase-like glycosyltransferase
MLSIGAKTVDKVTSQTTVILRPLVILACLAFFLFFWGLGDLPFYTRGEPREGLVVWEMYKSGNWILPIINGDYIPFKPPLFHWFALLVAMVAGHIDEFVVRFPSALFGTLGVVITYCFAARLWNQRTGLIAAVVLATSFEWWQAATITQVDMTLTFFISAALMLFYFVYQEEYSRRARSLLVALLLGLAALAKGPLGVVAPSFVIFVFLCIRRDLVFLKRLPLIAGAMVFLLVAGSWYGLAFLQGGWEFFRRQIIDETILTGVGSYGHHQPVYYFVPALFYNMLPWSFFFPGLAIFLFQRRHRLADDHMLYPLVWFVSVFVFFSVSLGKRGVYILPLYPAAALLFGVWWNAMVEGIADGVRLTRWVGFLYAISGLVALAVISLYVASEFELGGRQFLTVPKKFAAFAPILHSVASQWSTMTGVALLGGCLFLLMGFLVGKRWGAVFVCLTAIALGQVFVMKDVYLPYAASQRTMKPFMRRVTQRVESQVPLLFYRGFDYGTLFYSYRHIPSYATKFAALKRPYFLLMWEEDFKRLSETNHFKILDTSEGRGPAARHRLVLLEPEQDSPIVDPKGYDASKAGDDDSRED